MAVEMGYACSCGLTWSLTEWEDVETHINDNPTHTVTEAYFHNSSDPLPPETPIRSPGGDVYRVNVDNAGGVASDGISGQATKLPKSRQSASTDPGVDDDVTEGYEVGSRWINSSVGLEYLCTDNTAGSAVWKETTGVISTPEYAERTTPLSTTGTSWTQALRITTVNLPAGVYRIGWGAVGQNSVTGGTWGVRVQLDDSTNIIDPGNTGYAGEAASSSDSFQRVPFSGFRHLFLTAGVHTIDLDIAQVGSGTATLYYATLEIKGDG